MHLEFRRSVDDEEGFIYLVILAVLVWWLVIALLQTDLLSGRRTVQLVTRHHGTIVDKSKPWTYNYQVYVVDEDRNVIFDDASLY